MKEIVNIFFVILLTGFLFSCDEGRIYEEVQKSSDLNEGIYIRARIINSASWPSSYTVSIAAYEEGNDYALVSKSIGSPDEETGWYEISLTNIPASASTIEICVVNRLRQRIATFYETDIKSVQEGVNEIDSTIDVNMYDVIQREVFSTTCANCHGGSSYAAANLLLTEGLSYECLVDKPSEVIDNGQLRVKSGSRNSSILYNILTGDMSADWHYDHSYEITDYNILELIGAWIDNGANK